jgi:hypothetical protein
LLSLKALNTGHVLVDKAKGSLLFSLYASLFGLECVLLAYWNALDVAGRPLKDTFGTTARVLFIRDKIPFISTLAV